MPEGFVLTEDDHLLLREVIDDFKQRRAEVANRREFKPDLAPEAYIAKIPSEGIPARSGTTVSRALCDIWKLVPGGTELLQQVGLQKSVVNLTTTNLAGGIYVDVEREKWGNWTVSNAGGGQQIGILTNSVAHLQVRSVEILRQIGTYDDGDTAAPLQSFSPKRYELALNITGITLLPGTLSTGPYMYVQQIGAFEMPLVFPAQIEECFIPPLKTSSSPAT